MSLSSLIGSLGVSLLLIAFFLNQFRYISQEGHSYILLNIGGAGLSCVASLMIHFLPFVFLEAIWCGVALTAYAKKLTKGR
jgi:hypothetical protein